MLQIEPLHKMNLESAPEQTMQVDGETANDVASVDSMAKAGVSQQAMEQQSARAESYSVFGLESPLPKIDRIARAQTEAEAAQAAIDIVARSSSQLAQKVDETNAVMALPPPDYLAYDSLGEAALSSAVSYDPRSDPRAAEHRDVILDDVVSLSRAQQEIEREIFTEYSKTLEDLNLDLETTGDFFATAVPLRAPLAINKIAAAVGLEEEKYSTGSLVFVKSTVEAIEDKMQSAPPRERIEMMRRVLDLFKSGELGSIEGNTFLKLQVMNGIFYDLLNDDGKDWEEKIGLPDIKWTLWIDEFGEVMNWMGLPSIVKLAGKGLGFGVFKTRNLAARMLNNTNPPAAAQAFGDIARGDLNLARSLGVTQQEVLESLTPTAQRLTKEHLPVGVAERAIQVERLIDDANKIRSKRGLFYTDAEKAVMRDNLHRTISNMTGLSLDPSNTIVNAGSDAIRIKAIFTQSGEIPFTRMDDVREAADRVIGRGAKYTVLSKNPKGQWVELPKNTKRKRGQFKLQVDYEQPYHTGLANIDLFQMGNTSLEAGGHVGTWNQFLKDPNAMFGRALTALFNKASINPKGIASKLELAIKQDFERMPRGDRQQVLRVLQEGTDKEEVYDIGTLHAKGLTTAQQKQAYITYRQVADGSYDLANDLIRTEMQRNGFSAVYDAAGNVAYARTVDHTKSSAVRSAMSSGEGKLHMYDPATGSMIQMTADELDQLVDAGGAVGRLKYSVGGDDPASFIKLAEPGTQMKALPMSILPKRTGYVPRVYTDPLFVVRVKDGVQTVIASAPNKEYASRYHDNINALFPKWDIHTIPSRDMAGELTGRAEIDMMLDATDAGRGLIFGERGKMVPSATGVRHANIADPLQAIQKNIDLISRAAGSDEFLRSMETRLYNYMKDNGIVEGISTKSMSGPWWDKVRNAIRTGDPDFLKAANNDITKTKQLESARSYMELMNRFVRSDDKTRMKMRRWGLELSTMASRSFGMGTKTERFLVNSAQWWSEFNPTSWLARSSFDYFMAGHPVKQLLLQGSQVLLLSGLAPKQFLPAMRDIIMYSKVMKLARNENADKYMKAFGKTFGVRNVDEAFETVKYLADSGFIQQADSHMYRIDVIDRAGAVKTGRFAEAMATAGKVYTTPTNFLARYGFDVGEQLNRILTFAVMHRKHIADTGSRAKPGAQLDKVIADSLSMLGNTTAEASFAYQKNAFKLAFQFWSFQHKMWLMMAPKWLGGGRALTRAERMRMNTAQLLLFGAHAFPTGDTFMQIAKMVYGLPDDEDINTALRGGMIDYLFEMITDDDTDIMYSIRNAPAGGIVNRLLDTYRAFAFDKPPGELVLGATFTRMGSLFGAMRDAAALIQFDPDMFETPEQKYVAIAKTIGSGVWAGLNKASKLFYQSRLEHLTDSVDRKVVPATTTEIVVANLFGGTTDAQENFYEAQQYTDIKIRKASYIDSTVDVYTRQMQKLINEAWEAYKATDDPSWYLRLNEQISEMDAFIHLLEPDDAYQVKQKISQYLVSDLDENRLDSQVGKLFSMATRGGLYGLDRAKADVLRKNKKIGEDIAPYFDEIMQDIEDGGTYAELFYGDEY